MANAKTQQKILLAFLELLKARAYEDVSFSSLAESSGVKLSELRASYSSKKALVEAFGEMIDKGVLDDRDDDMEGQPARDRIFDVLMTRIDHLAPHKDAVATLHAAVRRDPGLALKFNTIAVRSQKWMLVAAGIDMSGLKGRLVAQGLAVAFARVVETWLNEDDKGMPRTMARLDKELDQGESWVKMLGRAEKMSRSFRKMGQERRRWGRSGRASYENEAADSALNEAS